PVGQVVVARAAAVERAIDRRDSRLDLQVGVHSEHLVNLMSQVSRHSRHGTSKETRNRRALSAEAHSNKCRIPACRNALLVRCLGGSRWVKLSGMTVEKSPCIRRARLLIADDRARTRRALRAMLATQSGLELVGEAADGEQALAAIERLLPDVVIIDVRISRI